jgi:Cd2+/Zn2+-exporting ATPase
MTENELLRIASIGESYSEHPLGKAIISKAAEVLGGTDEAPGNAEIITGQGIKFSVGGKPFMIGNRKLFDGSGISLAGQEDYIRSEEEKGRTAVIIGNSGGISGIISIADSVRPGTKDLVKKLRSQGIKKIVMLSGDNKRAARSISEEIGLDDYYGELMPGDKVDVLKTLQKKYGRTAMVGDGVNDAPALASADLGIAVGGAGADVAMETADVVLMSAEINKLPYAVGLSRATVRNMKQNIVFAIFVAALLLSGVLIKTVNLSFGMMVHEASVLLVIVNAVRLLSFGRTKKAVKTA